MSLQPARSLLNRTREVIELAPVSPPCFGARAQWVEWLVAGAAEQRPRHVAGPLLIRPGHPVAFDYRLDFCADCTASHQHAMKRAGRCDPEHLKKLAPPPAPHAPNTPAVSTAFFRPADVGEGEADQSEDSTTDFGALA